MAKKAPKETQETSATENTRLDKKNEFRHESLQDRESIVRYLNALSQGIANGQLTLRNREEQLILHPSGLLKLDVKARGKEERTKLVFKISWKENGHGDNPIISEITDIPPIKQTKS